MNGSNVEMDKQARRSFVSHEADEIYNNTNINECLETIASADEASRAMRGVLYHDMVGVAVNIFSSDGDLKLVRDVFRSYEVKYKRVTRVTSMPNAYRSCKSAIMNALKYNIPLHNDDGTVCGKTAIEGRARNARKHASDNGEEDGFEVKPWLDQLDHCVKHMRKGMASGRTLTPSERGHLRAITETLMSLSSFGDS